MTSPLKKRRYGSCSKHFGSHAANSRFLGRPTGAINWPKTTSVPRTRSCERNRRIELGATEVVGSLSCGCVSVSWRAAHRPNPTAAFWLRHGHSGQWMLHFRLHWQSLPLLGHLGSMMGPQGRMQPANRQIVQVEAPSGEAKAPPRNQNHRTTSLMMHPPARHHRYGRDRTIQAAAIRDLDRGEEFSVRRQQAALVAALVSWTSQ